MRDCRYSRGILPLRNSCCSSTMPMVSAAKEAIAKNQPMKASGSVGTAMLGSGALAAAGADRGEYALQQRGRRGRAAGHGDVHRDHVAHAAAAGVALAEDAAAAAAIADRD